MQRVLRRHERAEIQVREIVGRGRAAGVRALLPQRLSLRDAPLQARHAGVQIRLLPRPIRLRLLHRGDGVMRRSGGLHQDLAHLLGASGPAGHTVMGPDGTIAATPLGVVI